MPFPRASGILLHPTSLPSAGAIGDFGPAAYRFADFLAAARQTLWQVLPLNPVGYGNSPYSGTSAFAGNPLLISLERLADRGWLDAADLKKLPAPADRVAWDAAHSTKLALLRQGARNFMLGAGDRQRARLDRFKTEAAFWLDDFAEFNLLRERHQLACWNSWPAEFARRHPDAMAKLERESGHELEIERVIQFFFFEQWEALRSYCRRRRIRIVGDVAIFVSYDSAAVWRYPEIFCLGEDLQPKVVAGVPPDAFSATGQRWGNPLYDWNLLESRGFNWWIRRLQWALKTCDILRLDHFRGFEAYWEIPASEQTAINGRWLKGPNHKLFDAARQQLGELPLIAEDLGFITPEVHQMRERLGIPGMRVMQFGFSDRGAHVYLPHKFDRNTVVYTGTHDNDTTVGWWNSLTPEHQEKVRAYLGEDRDGMHWAMMRGAAASIADQCIVPLQDVLGLDTNSRMNTPSRPDGNWGWRFRADALTDELARKLACMTQVSDRDAALLGDQQGDGEAAEEFAA